MVRYKRHFAAISRLCTVYKITPSRRSKVLIEMLGKEFDGILGCDDFSAYHKSMRDFAMMLPFCPAHLIRDVTFLAAGVEPAGGQAPEDTRGYIYMYVQLSGPKKPFP